MTTSTADPAQPTVSTVVVAADGSVTVTQVSNATTVTYPGVVDTGFSPINLSPTIWVDASDETTITESGGAVSQWDDKSGNGNDLTQATSAYQPTTGTRTLNSLNVVEFDGTTINNLQKTSFVVTQPCTVLFVAETDTTSGERLAVSGASLEIEIGQVGNGNSLLRAGNSLSPSTGALTVAPHVFTATIDGASSSLRLDGTSDVTGDAGSNNFSRLEIGSRQNLSRLWDGAIAEVIVVDGTLTAQQIAAAEAYLANKWGITL